MTKQSKIYLAINLLSGGIFTFCVEAYIELIRPLLMSVDVVATVLSWRIVAFILQCAGLGAVCAIIRFLVEKGYAIAWNIIKRDIRIKGNWLSIHIKDNGDIRVGTVEIKQKYYELQVHGENIYKIQVHGKTFDELKKDGLSDTECINRLTVWEYHASYIRDYQNRPDFVGYYASARQDEDIESNEGIHVLRKFGSSKRPNYYVGTFNDVHRRGHRADTGDAHTGKLMLYRLDKDLKKIIRGDGNQKRDELPQQFVQSILNCNADVLFVRDLKNAIRDNCKQVQPAVNAPQ